MREMDLEGSVQEETCATDDESWIDLETIGTEVGILEEFLI